MMRAILLVILFLFSSCAATGENWILNKETDEMILVQKVLVSGWGSKQATFADGSNVGREETISDIVPDNVGTFN